MNALVGVEVAPGFAEIGVIAFTTTRERGDFALQSQEAASVVFGRWHALATDLGGGIRRLASAHQVHGDTVIVHEPGWHGWLRESEGDAHVSGQAGTAMAVTVADCVPLFLAHPRGGCAVVHSGWRGTEARIAQRAVERMRSLGHPAAELVAHCGPSICGGCYEVSPEVYGRLTGRTVDRPTPVDLRAIIAGQLGELGVRTISLSPWCTRCDNRRFYSHRAGDAGRQLGVIATPVH